MKKKEYIGSMLIEDFRKLSYIEQGKYLLGLKGVVMENEENININEICQQIDCSKEDYIQRYGYVSVEELQTHVNNIEEQYSNR